MPSGFPRKTTTGRFGLLAIFGTLNLRGEFLLFIPL
jgi:hypothetical protein